MTTQMDAFLHEIQDIRSEIKRLLEGIDYCFDWKPEDEEWSARETAYHIVDTPPGGIHIALQQILDGSTRELSITSSLTNLTPERQGKDVDQVGEEVEAVLAGLEKTLRSTTDGQLAGTRVALHLITHSTTEELTAQEFISSAVIRHWRVHLSQIAGLREMLGLE